MCDEIPEALMTNVKQQKGITSNVKGITSDVKGLTLDVKGITSDV
jgi:hypothetical protein